MIELERHIEILLLDNDCVIVPDLGGFMTHHVNARYVEEEQAFLPPLRTLGFNPQLKINDSLLAQSYVEAYDISYPEALQRIEDEVNELKQHLQNEGRYELNDIGVLELNEDGNYVFTPCEAGILTPELYGLGSYEFAKRASIINKVSQAAGPSASSGTVEEGVLGQAKRQSRATGVTGVSGVSGDETNIIGMTPIEVDEDDEDVVKIKFSWIRNTAAIAAVLLAIFLLALPTGKTEMMTRTISNINNGLLFGMMSKDSNTSQIEYKKVDIKTQASKPDTIIKKDTIAKAPVAKPEPVKDGYCIVLASYVSKKNANTFVDELKQKGYEESEVYIHNDVTRVVYGNFKTQEEAYQVLRKMHREKGLEEAWVYKKRG